MTGHSSVRGRPKRPRRNETTSTVATASTGTQPPTPRLGSGQVYYGFEWSQEPNDDHLRDAERAGGDHGLGVVDEGITDEGVFFPGAAQHLLDTERGFPIAQINTHRMAVALQDAAIDGPQRGFSDDSQYSRMSESSAGHYLPSPGIHFHTLDKARYGRSLQTAEHFLSHRTFPAQREAVDHAARGEEWVAELSCSKKPLWLKATLLNPDEGDPTLQRTLISGPFPVRMRFLSSIKMADGLSHCWGESLGLPTPTGQTAPQSPLWMSDFSVVERGSQAADSYYQNHDPSRSVESAVQRVGEQDDAKHHPAPGPDEYGVRPFAENGVGLAHVEMGRVFRSEDGRGNTLCTTPSIFTLDQSEKVALFPSVQDNLERYSVQLAVQLCITDADLSAERANQARQVLNDYFPDTILQSTTEEGA